MRYWTEFIPEAKAIVWTKISHKWSSFERQWYSLIRCCMYNLWTRCFKLLIYVFCLIKFRPAILWIQHAVIVERNGPQLISSNLYVVTGNWLPLNCLNTWILSLFEHSDLFRSCTICLPKLKCSIKVYIFHPNSFFCRLWNQSKPEYLWACRLLRMISPLFDSLKSPITNKNKDSRLLCV